MKQELDKKTVNQWAKRFVKRTPRDADNVASRFECSNSVAVDNPVQVSIRFRQVIFMKTSTDYRTIDVTWSAEDCRRLAEKLNGIADMLDFWNESRGDEQ